MVRISQCVRVIAISTLVAGLTAAQALAATSPLRPPTVPSNYVVTPYGYYHPSCVNHLAKGDQLLKDEKAIQRANGVKEQIAECPYPHFDSDGTKAFGDIKSTSKTEPSIGHAWVEWGQTTTTSSFAFLYSTWVVPPAPTTNDGQTIYLFNGFQDTTNSGSEYTIIQPVLGWDGNGLSGWSVAAWNCCVSGAVNESTPIGVNTGDLIYGYQFETCGTGVKSCGSWDVVAWDLTSDNFTDLVGTSSYGQTFNWAFGGVLEVYNIAQCSDYPNGWNDSYAGIGQQLDFFDQGLFNDKWVKLKPKWTIETASGLSPSCNYGGSVPEEVILTY